VGPRGQIEVQDTRHPIPELTVHYGQVVQGIVAKGEQVQASADEERRLDIARNHTATHLLHHALHRVIGQHAQQAGSLVAPDRLRFDFTHLQPVSVEKLRQIEQEVNAAIRADLPVAADLTSFDHARASGAIALFGEKYADTVRMISVGDEYGRELCGGTHLQRTGQIGLFLILSESSIGAGLRRIEAVTGRGAERYVHQQLDLLSETAAILQVKPSELLQRAQETQEQLREQQRLIERYGRLAARDTAEQLLNKVVSVQGLRVLSAKVEANSIERLREMIDQLREKLDSAVIVLGAVIADKPILVAAVTPDLVDKGVHAGNLVGRLARILGGGGGGRPTMAQAGGVDTGKLDQALDSTATFVQEML
ncbi:MAG: alanine--tRNA ligase, partial [Chloroflexi bacterium]|nr:alanine--tRNA ligase [Chloroflexota bacterium]